MGSFNNAASDHEEIGSVVHEVRRYGGEVWRYGDMEVLEVR